MNDKFILKMKRIMWNYIYGEYILKRKKSDKNVPENVILYIFTSTTCNVHIYIKKQCTDISDVCTLTNC